MAKQIELNTVDQLTRAIKVAKQIRIQVRFGLSERWVKITKAQVLELIEDDSETFGSLDKYGTLYLG